jgi:hypothetical protein
MVGSRSLRDANSAGKGGMMKRLSSTDHSHGNRLSVQYIYVISPFRRKDLLMSTRDEYIAQMKAKIDEWNAQFDELAAKVRQEKARIGPKYETQIAELTRKRDAAREKLKDLTDATENAWQALVQGAENVWDDFKETLRKSKDAFQEELQQTT